MRQSVEVEPKPPGVAVETVVLEHLARDERLEPAAHPVFCDAHRGGKQQLLDLATSGRAPFDVVIMQAQDRFSRQDGDIAFTELKALAKHCAVWFYADGRRFEHGTLATNVVGMLGAEFAAEFRRAIAAKTFEAMKRRAEQGYVTGGTLFGYDNVRVNGHVERRINAAEAAVNATCSRGSAAASTAAPR